MWVVYDPLASFPQAALFGRGVQRSNGDIIPPEGMAFFTINSEDLIHGNRAEFYEVTAPDVLTPKPQAEVDAILQAEADLIAARNQEINNARADVDTGPPPQSLPGLADRVKSIEILLGLKSYV